MSTEAITSTFYNSYTPVDSLMDKSIHYFPSSCTFLSSKDNEDVQLSLSPNNRKSGITTSSHGQPTLSIDNLGLQMEETYEPRVLPEISEEEANEKEIQLLFQKMENTKHESGWKSAFEKHETILKTRWFIQAISDEANAFLGLCDRGMNLTKNPSGNKTAEDDQTRDRIIKQSIKEARHFYKLFGKWISKDNYIDEKEKKMWEEAEMKMIRKKERKEKEKESKQHQKITTEEIKTMLNMADPSTLSEGDKIKYQKIIEKRERKTEKKEQMKRMTEQVDECTVFDANSKSMSDNKKLKKSECINENLIIVTPFCCNWNEAFMSALPSSDFCQHKSELQSLLYSLDNTSIPNCEKSVDQSQIYLLQSLQQNDQSEEMPERILSNEEASSSLTDHLNFNLPENMLLCCDSSFYTSNFQPSSDLMVGSVVLDEEELLPVKFSHLTDLCSQTTTSFDSSLKSDSSLFHSQMRYSLELSNDSSLTIDPNQQLNFPSSQLLQSNIQHISTNSVLNKTSSEKESLQQLMSNPVFRNKHLIDLSNQSSLSDSSTLESKIGPNFSSSHFALHLSPSAGGISSPSYSNQKVYQWPNTLVDKQTNLSSKLSLIKEIQSSIKTFDASSSPNEVAMFQSVPTPNTFSSIPCSSTNKADSATLSTFHFSSPSQATFQPTLVLQRVQSLRGTMSDDSVDLFSILSEPK
eukprot:MONOS_3618.1-p1 / transcript=MONOS_3618.1 / gene=MONOS_3618 / organism=Monocercomonoides_exilis_PA203 / gene_product=unspecified product / transcript_product=unspecified product / location=Mono_scaffold00086:111169-113681(-) / protein_length=693 / sequence_SO=supercontig / SO=protein_coding / is_pseudo=false